MENKENKLVVNEAEKNELAVAEKPRKKAWKGIVIAVAAVVVLIAAGVFGTYGAGMIKYNQNDYDGAKEVFTSLDFIPMFADMANACDYSKGSAFIGEGDYASAYELFAALGDYSDSASVANDLLYSMAVEHYENAEYNEAWEAFVKLGNYEDSVDYARKSRYAYADYLFSANSFEEAREIFVELSAYSDSEQRVQECDLWAGIMLYREGNYDEAIELFDKLYGKLDLAEDYYYLCRFQEASRYAGVGLNEVIGYYNVINRNSDIEDFKVHIEDPMFFLLRFFDGTWTDGKGFTITGEITDDITGEISLKITNMPWKAIIVPEDDMNQAFTVRQDDGLYIHFGSYNWFKIVSFDSYDDLNPQIVYIEDMAGNVYTLYRK